MQNDLVKVTARAVAEIQRGLTAYERNFGIVIADTRSCLLKGAAEFQMAVVRSQQRLRVAQEQTIRAEADLARCQENCAPLAAEVRRCAAAQTAAQRQADGNERAKRRYESASSDLAGSLRTLEPATEANIQAAKQSLLSYSEDLNRYLQTSALEGR